MGIYQRGDNWYIDFTFKGQRIRESIGPSRKGAEKVISKRKAEIAENKYLDVRKDPDPITFHEFAVDYIKWVKANHKPSSWATDISIMRSLEEAFDNKNIHEITTWDIEKWKQKRKAEVKPSTVNRKLAVLKSFFSKAIEWGKCQGHPASKVKLLKGVTKRLRYLMPEEVQRLVSNCADFLKPIVTLAVHTGMRKSEILGLKWSQINFEQGIITILESKNEERRDIPMDETIKSILKGIEPNNDLVFPNKKGKRIDNVFLYRAFNEALEKSEIGDFRIHDLRHTFASNLVMEGIDLNAVRELLGHKDLKMTLRYAHLAPNYRAKAVNVLDRVFDMSQKPPQEKVEISKVLEFKR